MKLHLSASLPRKTQGLGKALASAPGGERFCCFDLQFLLLGVFFFLFEDATDYRSATHTDTTRPTHTTSHASHILQPVRRQVLVSKDDDGAEGEGRR